MEWFSPVFASLPDQWMYYTISGLFVGIVVGLTGVGGGSLMTPILLYLGIPPLKAVGTDLLYAAITKAGGILVHQKKRTIDWKITGLLSLGSLPAALITLYFLHRIQIQTAKAELVVKLVLGIALFLTAFALIFKSRLQNLGALKYQDVLHSNPRTLAWATIVTGLILGFLVTLSSIGAGAIGTVVLFFLYPKIPTVRIVGTDIAHAVPLTAIAGMGHFALGSVNVSLLISLLIGSLPGIYIGSHMSSTVPDKVLRPVLATLLIVIGTQMVYKAIST